jgi:hypothetical protein
LQLRYRKEGMHQNFGGGYLILSSHLYVKRSFYRSGLLEWKVSGSDSGLCKMSNLVQQNTINPTYTGLDRCQIIEYFGLLCGTLTDTSSYR